MFLRRLFHFENPVKRMLKNQTIAMTLKVNGKIRESNYLALVHGNDNFKTKTKNPHRF
jgi:hypothetical protein